MPVTRPSQALSVIIFSRPHLEISPHEGFLRDLGIADLADSIVYGRQGKIRTIRKAPIAAPREGKPVRDAQQ